MADQPVLCVICYDISSNRQRRRAAGILETRAARVQDSVYEARLSRAQARRLMAKLSALVDPTDSIRLYAVPDAAFSRSMETGGPSLLGAGRFWLV